MRPKRNALLALIALPVLAACHLSIERDVHIESGETVRGSINTIEGDIIVGPDCLIRSSLRTVEGNIEIGRDSRVVNLQSVEGDIYLDRGVEVRRDVEHVEGEIICRSGVVIGGNINAIEGRIRIEDTVVEHDITTWDADIRIDSRSRVDGDIIIRRSNDDHDRYRQVRIEIAGGSVIGGDVENRDVDTDVRIYLSEGSRIEGRVRNAEVIRR